MIMLSKYWNYGIGGRDAVLLATMVMNGVNEIMTHDGALCSPEIFDFINSTSHSQPPHQKA